VEGRRCRTYQPAGSQADPVARNAARSNKRQFLVMGQRLEMGVRPRFAKSSFAKGSGHRTHLRVQLCSGPPTIAVTRCQPTDAPVRFSPQPARIWRLAPAGGGRQPADRPVCSALALPRPTSRSELVEPPAGPWADFPTGGYVGRTSQRWPYKVPGRTAGPGRARAGVLVDKDEQARGEGLPAIWSAPNAGARTLHERLTELASRSVTDRVI
jgi:hypothetical protein